MDIHENKNGKLIRRYYQTKIWEYEKYMKSFRKISWQLCDCKLYGDRINSNVIYLRHPFIQYQFILAKEMGINVSFDHYKFIEATLSKNYYKTLCKIRNCSKFKHYTKLLSLERKTYTCENSYYTFTTRSSRCVPNKNVIYCKSK